jgi:alpha-1,2-mannosyltransferase
LKVFGLQALGFSEAKIVGWIYTLVLLAIIYVVARRDNQNRMDNPLHWLAILILATLRSPLPPQSHATFPTLWLLSLVIATKTPTPKILVMFILGWLVFIS